MEQSENLLACPFCGSNRAKVWPIKLKQATLGYEILCDDCEGEGPYGGTPEAAQKAWNNRAGAGRASQDNGGKQLCSSGWLDALRESKDRTFRARVCYYDKHAKNPPGYNEVMTALNEAMRLTESASNGGDEARAGGPLPPSTGYLPRDKT